MSTISIQKVDSKSLLKEFVEFPINLYKGNPYFVPSLVYDEMMTLNKHKNPAFDFCDAEYFLVLQNNEIVGRIAAIINHKEIEKEKKNIARFGFVDFINDDNVVDLLFGTAEAWAKQKGATEIIGPLGFTDFDKEGLLVDGFDQISTTVTTYSFPYYKDQLERIGYTKDWDWVEYKIPIPKEVPERYNRINDLICQRAHVHPRILKQKKEAKEYIKDIFALLNDAYADLEGFIPLTEKQIDYYAKAYLPIIDVDFLSIIERDEDNKIVGFGVAIPSYAEALQKSKGRLLPLGWYHFLKASRGKQEKTLDLLLIAIDKEYQNKGLISLLFNQFIPNAVKNNFVFAETNHELENNHKVNSLWKEFGAVQHKRRRAYHKSL